MRLLLLAHFSLFLGLSLNAETMQDDIARHYHQSVKDREFGLAQKLLECCYDDKHCQRIKVMKDALNQAMADKDAETTSWINAELKQQKFIDRLPVLGDVLFISGGIAILAVCGFVLYAKSIPGTEE